MKFRLVYDKQIVPSRDNIFNKKLKRKSQEFPAVINTENPVTAGT